MATTQDVVGTITGYKRTSTITGVWDSSWTTNDVYRQLGISNAYKTSEGSYYFAHSVCYRFQVSNSQSGGTAKQLLFKAKGVTHINSGSRDHELKATFYEEDPTTSSAGGMNGGVLSLPYNQGTYQSVTYKTNINSFTGTKTFYVIVELTNVSGRNEDYFTPISVSVRLSLPLTVNINEDSVKPNEYFTVTFGNRLSNTLTVKLKYGKTILSTFTNVQWDTFETQFYQSYLSDINKSYGQLTVEATDDQRVGTDTVNFQLESLEATTSKSSVETGGSVNVSIENVYNRNISYKVKSGSALITSGTTGDSITFTPTASWFSSVGNKGNSLSVTVELNDDLGRSTSVGFTVTAGPEMYPTIGQITLTNVPAANMPSGYGYVAGYSKVKISVAVTKPSIATSQSVVVSYAGASNKSMSYNSSTQKYEVTVGPITGNTTFTVTATDSNTRQAQRSKQLTGVTTLNALSITLNNYSVTAGNSVTATVSNNVGNYSYSIKKGSTTVGSESGLSSDTFNFATSSSWFPTDGSVIQLTIKVVVTDVLGRTAENNLTVNLPPLTVSLNKSTVLIGEQIVITLGGITSQTVALQLKYNNTVLDTPTVSNNTVTVTCPKSWFSTAEVTNKSSMDITVSATRGTFTATASFVLSFPTLGISADKTSVSAGQDITYTFTNRESETLTIKYNYQSTEILQQSVSANTVTITNSKALFDTASVTTNQSLVLTVIVSDSYGRSANLSITINASSDMAPSITSVVASIVQPSPASQTFPNTYIANVSKAKISVGFSRSTNASISSATLKYGSVSIVMVLNTSTGEYEGTTTNPLTGNTTFTVTLTDQRGMSSQQTYTLSNVQAYSQPKIDIQSYNRCNQDGTKNDAGEWCYLSIVYTFTYLNGQNARNTTVTLGSSTVSRQVTSEVEETYILPADMEHSYDIVVVAIDSITSVSKTVRLSTAGVIMDFLTGGKGIGLGKVAEYQNMVEINPEWEFKCRVRVNGTLVDLGTILESLLQQ